MFFGLVFKECSFHLSYGQGRNHLLENVNLICIWMNIFPTRLPISNSEECHVRWCCSRQVSSREWMYSIVYSQFSEIHNSFLSGLLRMNIFFNRKKKKFPSAESIGRVQTWAIVKFLNVVFFFPIPECTCSLCCVPLLRLGLNCPDLWEEWV